MDTILKKSTLKILYGKDSDYLKYQAKRYQNLLSYYVEHFELKDSVYIFSSPGRIEIGGNHTDHNHGKVLAASVNIDSIAAVSKNTVNTVIFHSKNFHNPFQVSLEKLEKRKNEQKTTSALIRGIAARFNKLGYNTGGFNACMFSDIKIGSGLSSSASVEVLIASIFNKLFNNSCISPEKIAQIAQFAENYYFNKPCGLMDQLTCSCGGILAINFKDPESPEIKKINFNFSKSHYSILVVDTGSNHADLTDDYSSIPLEMKNAAHQFDKNTMGDISEKQFINALPQIRKKIGDRAILRAIHFIQENKRVDRQIIALENNNFTEFLKLISESGNSSFKYLQNCYSNKNIIKQSIPLALALTENFIKKTGSGSCRVHGGGFAGTIEVFLPDAHIQPYKKIIEPVFGKNSVMKLQIRTAPDIFVKKIDL